LARSKVSRDQNDMTYWHGDDRAGGLSEQPAGSALKIMALVSDLGFEPLDCGGLKMARLLEPSAMVWINQAVARNVGASARIAARIFLPGLKHVRI
jgi:hypothetical protein